MGRIALSRAIDIVGGQRALASMIGVRQSYIWYWLNRAKRIPAIHAPAIEEATQGQVSKEELCPEAFAIGSRLDGTAA